MKKQLFYGFILLSYITLIGCATTGKIDKDDSMYLMIYDYDNNGVQSVSVHVDGNYIGDSDIHGRFTLNLKDTQEHTLTLTKDGYESVEKNIYFDPVQIVYVKMGNATQYLSLAEDAVDCEDLDNALNLIDRSLELAPERYDSLYLKCIILYKLKRYGECMKIISAVDSSVSSYSYFNELRNRIDEVK